MYRIAHCAIDIATHCNYDNVIKNLLNGNLLRPFLPLSKNEGALFSYRAINKIIEEEIIHQQFEIKNDTNSSLQSMSSGEQKIALLQNILAKNPAFIIVENVLDNLDTRAQSLIVSALQKVAAHTLIIQIINRQKDILPFIQIVYVVQNDKIVQQQSLAAYLSKKTILQKNILAIALPTSINNYNLPNTPIVQLQNVSVNYGDKIILNNINWTINAGEFWQLKGPNGSGKTTLLNLITGDNTKGYGQQVFLFGKRKGTGETVWDIKQKIGYITTTLAQFYPRLDSAEKMILSGFFDSIGLYKIPSPAQINVATDWLKIIGLYNQKNTPFCFLPLAMQQMVLVARAMVKCPPLLILDEPTMGLDDNATMIFTSLINKICNETPTTILYVSHRTEIGLAPKYFFELIPTVKGSVGKMGH